MRLAAFTLLTIAGAFGGLIIGAAEDNRFTRIDAMTEKAIAGTVCGMIVGGIAVWVAGGPTKKE